MKSKNSYQKSNSTYNVSLLLLKIEHSFFQESIDNNKSIGVTIPICQRNARRFQNDLFQKAPDQKSSNKA